MTASPIAADQAQRFYDRMLWIRLVEEQIAARYGKAGEPQEMRCPVHLSIGQEAAAVGVCEALRTEDLVFSTHRCHAHYLAKGGALDPMLGEIYGKATGCIGGRGGSMHLTDLSVGMFLSIPIVASVIPLAVGAALSMKLDGADSLACVFFGDAALEEGVWHEAANFARVQNLPVLFVCENNFYSVYTPLHQRQPDAQLTRFADAHRIPVFTADGNDVEATFGVTEQAVAAVRKGEGPAFLSLETYRFREHCGPNYDDHLGYRAAGELEEWQARDPLTTYAAALKARDVWTTELDGLNAAYEAEIDKAFTRADAAPLPTPDMAGDHVYA